MRTMASNNFIFPLEQTMTSLKKRFEMVKTKNFSRWLTSKSLRR